MKSNDPILFTQEKIDALTAEMEERKTSIRATILTAVESARELGDLKENAEYHAARDEQGKNESRIREIEEMLRRAQVVKKSEAGVVGITSVVTIQKKGTDKQKVYTIVGEHEADIANKKIANTSPLGEALMGKAKGEEAVFETAKGEVVYEVVEVK